MTSRRNTQLAKRVEKWQSLLGPLGLSHYRIERVSTTDAPNGNPWSLACVTPSTNYDQAVFEFRNDIVDHAYDEEDYRQLDSTIIHEWMHVAFKALDNAIELADDHLAPAVREMWQTALENASEQLIDRIAQQLYDDLKDYV